MKNLVKICEICGYIKKDGLDLFVEFGILVIGIWDLFVICDLEFGISTWLFNVLYIGGFFYIAHTKIFIDFA